MFEMHQNVKMRCWTCIIDALHLNGSIEKHVSLLHGGPASQSSDSVEWKGVFFSRNACLLLDDLKL